MAAQFLHQHGIDLQREMDNVQKQNSMTPAEKDSIPRFARVISKINNIRRPSNTEGSLWDILFESGEVARIEPRAHSPTSGDSDRPTILNVNKAFLLPSLCHPHIHLDKCFLFSHAKYDDLEVLKGDFAEALELTSKAKGRFEHDDLMTRGEWLVRESMASGVTHIRAFVEVDTTVEFKCLDAGLQLKRRFAPFCEIQICVFVQEPVFSEGKNYPRGKLLIEEALSRDGVDALGSTPYVESSPDLMRANVEWAISTAVEYRKHLDLHLDYNLDSTIPPLTFHVLDLLRKTWMTNDKSKTVVLGHCTRLTLFKADEWRQLRDRIADLPVYFVGLPTSDIFMMGKPSEEDGGGQGVRGTLQIPQMIQKYGLQGCIGVNNIGNAFTPYGNCDPMSIASMGVGIYQAGTKADAEVLFDCVSSTAKTAIGFPQPEDPFSIGAAADFVLFENAISSDGSVSSSARPKRTLQEILHDPPVQRQTIFRGRLVPKELPG